MIEFLKQYEEKEYAEFTRKLTPTQYEVRGIRLPKLRELAKEVKEPFIPETHEEILLLGFYFARKKSYPEELKRDIKTYLKYVDNWATCDSFAASLKSVKRKRDEYIDLVKECVMSDKEYEVRFSYVFLMDYYLEDKYFPLIEKSILSASIHTYYVDMAISWLIATYAAKDYDKATTFLLNSTLSDFIVNKSIQKMVESFRIPDEKKAELKKMKRKTN